MKHIIKRVKVELGLEEQETSGGPLDDPINQSFIDRIPLALKNPGPSLYTAMAVALIILILIPVSFLREESEGPPLFSEPAPVLMTPTSDEELAGIKVTVSNKKLSISQPIKLKRELKVYNESGELIGISGRAINDSQLRYLTMRFVDDVPLIYNLNNVDNTKTVYVTEGPIDSLFLPNSIAVGGSDFKKIDKKFKDNAILVYDNEPRSTEIIKKI